MHKIVNLLSQPALYPRRSLLLHRSQYQCFLAVCLLLYFMLYVRMFCPNTYTPSKQIDKSLHLNLSLVVDVWSWAGLYKVCIFGRGFHPTPKVSISHTRYFERQMLNLPVSTAFDPCFFHYGWWFSDGLALPVTVLNTNVLQCIIKIIPLQISLLQNDSNSYNSISMSSIIYCLNHKKNKWRVIRTITLFQEIYSMGVLSVSFFLLIHIAFF